MRITLLSGGVGGARLARALDRPDVQLTVVVNVGDDALVHGVHVSPDLDTVVYTLAGSEGPAGWGIADDTTRVMDTLAWLGADTTFTIGDRDLATNLYRTAGLAAGRPLSALTAEIAEAFGLDPVVTPVTDDAVRTLVHLDDAVVEFQEYFVARRHVDPVRDLTFDGASEARPAPGVLAAIADADVVVIGPSNPPLSIWPILAVPGITDAVADAERVFAISPLFGGTALKGPAHAVMRTLGLPAGNAGVVAAYDGLLSDLVVDVADGGDRTAVSGPDLRVHVTDTRFADKERATAFGEWLCRTASA